jgi:glucose 1-dehydrogenase
VRLQGKTAIVTGGDTGIGKAISLAFAREGAAVIVDYHGDIAPANALVKQIESSGGKAAVCGADVSKPEDVEALVQKAVDTFGGLDVMVNNAGIEDKLDFIEVPFDVYQKTVAVNLTGTWLGSQTAAKRMIEQKRGGRIINISSIHEDRAMPTNAAYCATKGGIRMLTRTIAISLAQHGITVNDVCPGAIDTPMDEPLKRNPKEMEQLLSEIPLRRMGKPEEVAELCVYLASDAAAYVTGASLFIDGGMSQQSGSL